MPYTPYMPYMPYASIHVFLFAARRPRQKRRVSISRGSDSQKKITVSLE